MKSDYDLSYHCPFPAPSWGNSQSWVAALPALLLVLAPVGVILLYFLKLKRRPLQVPSTFLWKKSIEDLHVNALFQWLRQNVILLLQLLVLLILIYAALGLRFHGQATIGKHYILMIDNSASMATSDVKPSRLEWAKEEALKIIDAADESHQGMVIVFNSTASTLQSYTTDKGELRRAVNSIQQTNRQTRIEDALTLADNLANQYRSTDDAVSQPENQDPDKRRTMVPAGKDGKTGIPTEVFLFTDGVFQEPSAAALATLNSLLSGNTLPLGNLHVHFHQAGVAGPEHVDNVGIVSLDAERADLARAEDNKPRPDGNVTLKVFVEVHNHRPRKAEVKVRLDVRVKGQLVHSDFQQIEVPPRRVTTKLVEGKETPIGEPGIRWAKFAVRNLDMTANPVLHAFLEGVQDHFPLDDEAWLVLAPKRRAKVLVVSTGNLALDAFFDQGPTQELAEVIKLKPSDLDTNAYRHDAVDKVGYDLVIFDRCAPKEAKELPLAHTLFIGTPPPPWQPGKLMTNLRPIVSKANHPLLRNIKTMKDVAIGEAFEFPPRTKVPKEVPEEAAKKPRPQLNTVLETTEDRPLLFSMRRGPYKDLVMTFALFNDKGDLLTNWPLRRSFPVFLRNVLLEYGNLSIGGRSLQAGEPFQFRPEPGVNWLEVLPPKGEAKPFQRRGNPKDPDLVFSDTEQLGLYELVSAGPVRRSFAVNLLDPLESDIEPRKRFKVGSDTVEAEPERRQPYDLWKWFALGALVLLLLEWYVYNRRVFV